jgi:transposase-like protein
MGKRGYPPEFRRRVLVVRRRGRRQGREVAHDLWIGVQTICNWRCQDRIDRGLETGMSSAEKAELAAARKRIRELEAEVAVHRRATSCSRKTPTQRRFVAIGVGHRSMQGAPWSTTRNQRGSPGTTSTTPIPRRPGTGSSVARSTPQPGSSGSSRRPGGPPMSGGRPRSAWPR